LKTRNLDWDRLEENLAEIGELFKLLPLNGAGPSGAGEAQLDPGLHKQLQEVLAQRRKNEEILQAKARELGRQITLAQAREDGGSCVHCKRGAGQPAQRPGLIFFSTSIRPLFL